MHARATLYQLNYISNPSSAKSFWMQELLFSLESGICPPSARLRCYPKSSVYRFSAGMQSAPSDSQHQDWSLTLRFLSLAWGSQTNCNNIMEASIILWHSPTGHHLPLPLHLALGPTTYPVFEALCESCGPIKTSELKTWPLQLCSELGLWVQRCVTFLPSGTQDLSPWYMDRRLKHASS